MEDLSLAVPGLWADHHVLAVLELLRGQQGISAVAASARDGVVRVRFDPQQTDAPRIAARLREGGYDTSAAAAATSAAGEAAASAPGWAAGLRVTTTDPVDLSMSGDHRKY